MCEHSRPAQKKKKKKKNSVRVNTSRSSYMHMFSWLRCRCSVGRALDWSCMPKSVNFSISIAYSGCTALGYFVLFHAQAKICITVTSTKHRMKSFSFHFRHLCTMYLCDIRMYVYMCVVLLCISHLKTCIYIHVYHNLALYIQLCMIVYAHEHSTMSSIMIKCTSIYF